MRELARSLLTPDAISVGITYIIVWTVIVISILWIIDAVERRRAERERAEREAARLIRKTDTTAPAWLRESRDERFGATMGGEG